MALLELNDITLQYERSGYQIKDFSMHIKQGEFLGIVGESGCGKSTIGKLLIGLINQSEWEYFGLKHLQGSLVYKGDSILSGINLLDTNYSILRRYRKQIQMIFQNPRAALNMNFTLEDTLKESIRFGTSISSTKRLNQKVLDLCKKVELLNSNSNSQIIKNKNSQLSGGQMKRVSIAKALAVEPDVIIADEPLTGLDASIRGKVLRVLYDEQERRLATKNPLTMIFISHDIGLVADQTNRVVVMEGDLKEKQGRIIQNFEDGEQFQLIPNDDYETKVNELIRAAQYFQIDESTKL